MSAQNVWLMRTWQAMSLRVQRTSEEIVKVPKSSEHKVAVLFEVV